MPSEKSTFAEIFEVLAKGRPEQFKEVKRLIEKKWNSDHESFNKEWLLIKKLIEKFDSISDSKNKAAVISGMSFFYLVFGDNHFEILKDFVIKNLTNSNGQIRESMRHTADWLYGSLTSRAEPFVYPKEKPLSHKQIEEQKIAIGQYFSLVKEVEDLMEKYDDGKDNSEYIDQMKPSVHKSLQTFWSRLTDNRVYRHLLEKNTPIPFELLMKRKEIETEIAELLNQAKSFFDVKDVKEAVYEEEGTSDMQDIIAMFDTGELNAPSIDSVLEVVSDAWNYFPHRQLNNLCPKEVMEKL